MVKRSSTTETVVLALELLRRIPRTRKVTAAELHAQLMDAGMVRDLRTIQRQLDMLSSHFDIERDDKNKPYGYRWREQSKAWVIANLTPQESLMLLLAEEHLKTLLPANLRHAMSAFFIQARRNLGHDAHAHLEREWPTKVRVVAANQPLLPPKIGTGIFEVVSEALYHNRWLYLNYQNATGYQSAIEVMPLGLVQQGPRLYLVCRYRDHDNERNLALHRILHAEMSTLGFERPQDFDLEKYDQSGRFAYGDGQLIRLTFVIEETAGFHLLETPLSSDQTVSKGFVVQKPARSW